MKKLLCLPALVFLLSISAFADIRLETPTPKTKPTATRQNVREVRLAMNIRANSNTKETTLEIPKSAIKELRAQLDAIESGDDETAAAVVSNEGFNFTRAQTLAGGLFLSLAFVFGGVRLMRGGKSLGKPQKAAIGLIVAAIFGASSALVVFANVAPTAFQGINGSILNERIKNRWRGVDGEVKIVIYDDENSGKVLLTMPKEGDFE